MAGHTLHSPVKRGHTVQQQSGSWTSDTTAG